MKTIFYGLILASAIFISCSSDNTDPDNIFEVITPENPLPKNDRKFGVVISESTEGFDASLQEAMKAGIQRVELNIPWTAIETAEGVYQDPYGGILQAIAIYGANNIEVSFSIAVINTVQWEIPTYLEGVDPSSDHFITAFTNMMDWFLSNVHSSVTVSSISVGNEIDLVLESADDWTAYTNFYQAVAEHMHQQHQGIKIGVKTTVMGGLLGHERTQIQDINQYSDVIMLNYYPQNASFEVLDPTHVHSTFETITDLFPGDEIWIMEIGYQSGSDLCKSSEEQQAMFFHEVFTAWDNHQDQIKFVLVDWLHDQSPEMIEEWKSYYGDHPALVEYIATLGLRNHDHTDKHAWQQLLAETNARGW